MNDMKVISELTNVANSCALDTEANMPDFIIGTYLYEAMRSLMTANKANQEYFKLSAQEDEAT